MPQHRLCRSPRCLRNNALTKQLMSNISATGDIQTLRETAVKMGMKPLRLAGAEKVIMGVTSIEEVMRVTPEWER